MAQMSRRTVLKLGGTAALAAAAMPVLAACGRSSSGSGTSAPPVTPSTGPASLTFIGAVGARTMAPVTRGFHQAFPSIQLTYDDFPFDQYQAVQNERLQGKDSSFDLYTVDQSTIVDRAARGYLQDITGVFPKLASDVLPVSYQTCGYQGRIWAVPIYTSTAVMLYNIALLKKAGIDPPGIEPKQRWTWDRVVAAAKKAQGAGASYGLLWEQHAHYYSLEPLPVSLGGGTGLKGKHLLDVDITNNAWIQAMSWYGGLYKSGISPRGLGDTQMTAAFQAGQGAFWIGRPGNPMLEDAKTKGQIDWGVAPMPYFRGGKPITPTDGWSWGVNPQSKHKAQALEVLKYGALTKGGSLATIEAGPQLPANSAAFQQHMSELGRRATEPAGLGELISYELAHTAVHRPRSLGYVQFEQVMNEQALNDIVNGADVRKALQAAASKLDQQFAPLRKEVGG